MIITLNGRRQINVSDPDGADGVCRVPRAILPLLPLLLLDEPPRLRVPPHVGAAVRRGDIEERDALEGRAVGQVQLDAITLST